MQLYTRLQPLTKALSGSSRFLALFGPGTTDHLLASGGKPVAFLQALGDELAHSGFERVVVYAPHQSLTCLHGSLYPTLSANRLAALSRQGSRDCMHFLTGGPLQDLQVYVPAGTLTEEMPELMGDAFALRTMDRIMRATTTCSTALVISQAALSLQSFEDQRLLGGYMSDWSALPLENRNRCLLVFDNHDRSDLAALADTLTVPAVSRLLRQANSSPLPEALVEIGYPTVEEAAYLLEMLGDAGAETDEDLQNLADKLSAEPVILTEWMNRLQQMDEISFESIRRRGWFSASSGDSSALERLNSMVGLDAFKARVAELAAWLKVSRSRLVHADGMPAPLLHMIFSGAPGTGKTTAARLVGEILHEAGILKRGHLVEATTADMVAEYVGGTAIKTNLLVDRALDGVLFIDEAYMLTESERGGFGLEALETLMARMENDRSRLVVIAAGYGERMARFRSANPGLARRFPQENIFEFTEYSSQQLLQIFLSMLKERRLTVTPEFEVQLSHVIDRARAVQKTGFGNAGEMRNLADALDRRSAIRIVQNNLPLDAPLCLEDLPPQFRQKSVSGGLTSSSIASRLQALAEIDGLELPLAVARKAAKVICSTAQEKGGNSSLDGAINDLYIRMKRRLADRLYRQSQKGLQLPDSFGFQLNDLPGASIHQPPLPGVAHKPAPPVIYQHTGRLSGFLN